MADKILQIIPVTPDLSVILFQAPDPKDGAYISIKHNEKVNNMPGEAMLIPEEVPALVKALTEAAMELIRQGYYFEGFTAGRHFTRNGAQ